LLFLFLIVISILIIICCYYFIELLRIYYCLLLLLCSDARLLFFVVFIMTAYKAFCVPAFEFLYISMGYVFFLMFQKSSRQRCVTYCFETRYDCLAPVTPVAGNVSSQCQE